MPAIDSTAAQLCTALYQFDGYPIVQFDHIIQNEDNDFYVGIKRIGDTDYVVFRGSSDAADWLHNLETFTTYYPGLGGLHHGFAAGMDDAWAQISKLIGPKFVITGHSRGAAQAHICTGYAVLAGKMPLALVTFGSPRPGYQQLADVIQPVPRTPGGRGSSAPGAGLRLHTTRRSAARPSRTRDRHQAERGTRARTVDSFTKR